MLKVDCCYSMLSQPRDATHNAHLSVRERTIDRCPCLIHVFPIHAFSTTSNLNHGTKVNTQQKDGTVLSMPVFVPLLKGMDFPNLAILSTHISQLFLRLCSLSVRSAGSKMIVWCVDNHNSDSQPDLASLQNSILLHSHTYSKCFSYPRAYFTYY